MNILEANHITKRFTGHTALDDVSLAIPEGKVYGLLGPNGAGKTTMIRIINHITAPDEGEVLLNGHKLVAGDVKSIGYLPEERGLYKKMKVGEQAMFFARLKGLDKAQARKSLDEWFQKLEITSWWDKKIEELSKGMAQKVQFIITVLHRPRLLIFDEPFSGFDPINANVLKREILELRDQGATVIFSTHNMSSVEELCDNITLINKSKNILTGSVRELKKEFSDNTYEFTFRGDVETLTAAAGNMARTATPPENLGEGLKKITFSLNEPDTLKPLIAAANQAVDLRSFSEVLPSMDDIFIKSVSRYNAEHRS